MKLNTAYGSTPLVVEVAHALLDGLGSQQNAEFVLGDLPDFYAFSIFAAY